MSEKFIPRDFIYINEEKLNSYFSQLYGGLVTNLNEIENEENTKETQTSAKGKGEFSTKIGNSSILGVINSIIGADISLGGEVELNHDRIKQKNQNHSKTSEKVLSHFKYTMFEESIINTGYLIDLDSFIERNNDIDSGKIRSNLKSTDFLKFTSTSIELRDYRNASEFISLLKKIYDIAVEIKSGEIKDNRKGTDEDEIKKISELSVVKELLGDKSFSNKNMKIFEVMIKIIDEIFKGDIIPLDLMMISEKETVNNRGSLRFESLLKEKYFLEDRVDLSFKYGTFEDAQWTIIGQLTTVDYPEKNDLLSIIDEYSQKFKNLTSEFDIDINEFIKIAIKEIDVFSKKVGLMPQLSERNPAFTPIAIFREPTKNEFFQDN